MGVGLDGIRHVEVDDMGYACAVNASRSDVRCHHDVETAVAESVQGAQTLALAHVALQKGAVIPFVAEFSRQVFGLVLGAREDEHAFVFTLFENIQQDVPFLAVLDGVQAMVHGFDRNSVGDFDCLGIVENLIGELANVFGHGGREEKVLSLVTQSGKDALDVRHEAHVEHAVRFIKHQRIDRVQLYGPFIEKANQASGAGNDDLAALESLNLRVHAHSAYDDIAAYACLFAEVDEALMDLQCQFTRRCQDKNFRRSLGCFGVEEALKDGERECRRLSRTCLSEPQNIVSFEDRSDGPLLDGRGGFIATRFDARRNATVKRKGSKSHITLW